MSILRMKLHNQILLALILGALFGAMFHISKHQLEITHVDPATGKQSTVIESWQHIEFLQPETGEVLAQFGGEDQLLILQFFGKIRKTLPGMRVVSSAGDVVRLDRVSGIAKVQTIATLIKPVGTIFIKLLMFVAIPLVLSSLIVGAASLGDIKKVGKLGMKTLAIYLTTTTIAVTIGLVVVNTIQPGTRLTDESREKLMVEFQGNMEEKIQQEGRIDVVQMIVDIVATNPIKALATGEMLQIIFFALMVGVSLTMISHEKADPVVRFFDGFSELMIRMVEMIIKIAPYGVFALIAATVGEFGFEILQTLAWYSATLIFGLLLHLFVILGLLVKFLGRMNPVKFFMNVKEVMLIAFSSSSSAAGLPLNMEVCEKKLGVPKKITSFVLPLGATINMDGTALYQAVATVFIAQVYGVGLDLVGQLTIILLAVLASIGTAPVPGVGLIMLIIVLRSVNVPEEGIALILGIDRILDMCRTAVNVTGDAAVALVMARQEENGVRA